MLCLSCISVVSVSCWQCPDRPRAIMCREDSYTELHWKIIKVMTCQVE